MNQMDTPSFLDNDTLIEEGPNLAFFQDIDILSISETIAAFANTGGGEICLFGLGDLNEAKEHFDQACKNMSPAPAQSPPYSHRKEGELLHCIYIPRSVVLHALEDGRVLIRRGVVNSPLGGQGIQRLVEDKNSGVFEECLVKEATIDDFDEQLLKEYAELRDRRSRSFLNSSIKEILREINAVDQGGIATINGILTFCSIPQRWLPQSSIVFVKFLGTSPRGFGGQAGFSRREEISGPLPRLIERTWQYIWSEMAVSAVVHGLEREETTEYPPFAVREAIVNAVCHRDYRMRGRRIEVRMFADRLEVISPGGLPGFVTVENLVDEHYSRNPRIVHNLYQWGYIEGLGLGIDRMIEVMKEAGHQPPSFDARENSFTVTLYNSRVPQNLEKLTPRTNQRQDNALEYLRHNGSITNREYKKVCTDVSSETLRLDLADLVRKGLIQKLGDKKGTRYVLPPKS